MRVFLFPHRRLSAALSADVVSGGREKERARDEARALLLQLASGGEAAGAGGGVASEVEKRVESALSGGGLPVELPPGGLGPPVDEPTDAD
mmetsp:Transcript_8086/g.26476  ORF Transcript_8086/g.26476 Transcript_8086/m.26476 type:complete len:91 (+) Transcript_8086:163-435(+)